MSPQGAEGAEGWTARAIPETPDWESDFENPKYKCRRLFSESLGTFLLILVACGAGAVDAVSGGSVGRAAIFIAPGLMLMAIILFMGKVSGAHLNPAVTVGFAARGDFPWRRVPGYILAQSAGAVAACLLLVAMFGRSALVPTVNMPGPGFTVLQAVVMETVLTFGLVSVILGTASKAQNVGPLSALAAGGYLVVAGLWAGPVSGASMNPARALAPDVVLGDLSYLWIYLIGPITGSLLAVLAAAGLRGPGGDRTARKQAQGEPERSEEPRDTE